MRGIRPIYGILLLGAALAAAAPQARADQDAVHFFRNIHVTADQPVQDAVCLFCNVYVDGKVNGDLVVLFGNVYLNGAAHHDVVNIFGSVSAADNSTIGGDLVNVFGGIRLGQNVSVGKDLVSVFGPLHTPSSVTVKGDRVELPALLFWGPFILLFAFIVVIVHELRAYRERRAMAVYQYPPHR